MTGNYVYVMAYGPRDHKIGFSVDPAYRRKALPGVEAIIRTWYRPFCDAQVVESVAHRLLAEWRLDIPNQWERFSVSESAACCAVECAAAIVADAIADKAAERVQQKLGTAEKARNLPEQIGPTIRIGYICQPDESMANLARDVLIKAGVDAARLYIDISSFGAWLNTR